MLPECIGAEPRGSKGMDGSNCGSRKATRATGHVVRAMLEIAEAFAVHVLPETVETSAGP
eukprot:14329608-Alexandrium_andersonii.AAC.1